MADKMSLFESHDDVTVTFTPLSNDTFIPMQGRKRITHKALDGTNYTYELHDKGRTEISINALSKADYDTLYDWWNDADSLTYIPDTDVSNETYIVKITNETNPFRMMPNTTWESKYEGTMILEEV